MSAITSTTAVRTAYAATASVLTYWTDAYNATRDDLNNGATVRAIADAWKEARITPANKDSVGDMAEAARLTDMGGLYWSSVADVLGEGVVLYPHALILRARKARGMAYVRATLTAMESVTTLEDVSDEDAAKAVVKAVRTLAAAKREPKPDVTDEATTDEATTDEADETTDAPSTATADDRADAVIALLSGMVKGHDLPDESRRLTMVSLMRELTAQWTYARDVEHVA